MKPQQALPKKKAW